MSEARISSYIYLAAMCLGMFLNNAALVAFTGAFYVIARLEVNAKAGGR